MKTPRRHILRSPRAIACLTTFICVFAVIAVAPSTAFAQDPASGETDPPDDIVTRIWEYELFSVGETTIRVNQIVTAILLVIVGVIISRWITRLLRSRLQRRGHIDPNTAAAIEKILFYLLAVTVLMVGLQVVHVPLTAFTVFGGAVAIGVGFGAQNLINNFISGLILMLERPVRIGDLVEIDDHIGRVESIGGRCTNIRRTDGVDLLVPNSALLENNVINWTLSDKHIRTKLTVGVIYGSPTDVVAKLIRQAVEGHQRVLKTPDPILLFEEFGDNALIFDIYFWAEVEREMDLREIKSDLRFEIDRLFRDA
ncbi:MAG: hypothetical protein CMJ49_12620, partial [Planctomycetaceae bacterium]|nr:hypothetical protein [Planctomycetaceae bacterium]